MGSEVIGERSIKKLNKTWQLPTLRSLPIECFLPKACCIAFCLLIGPRHANHIQSKSSTWLSIQIWVCSQKRKQTEQQQTNRILANLQVKGTKVPVHGILQAAHAHLQHADRKIHQYNNSIRFSKDKSDTSKVSINNPKFWVSFNLCHTTGHNIHDFIQMKITTKEIQSNNWLCFWSTSAPHLSL